MKLRLFYRSMLRQKLAWTLNLVCLSVAFAVLFIVIKQVKYDFSFDTCYPQHEDIYQLGYYSIPSDRHESYICLPLIQGTLEAIPEVTAYTPLFCTQDEKANVYCGETEYPDVPYYGVFSGFPEVFQPRILAGDAEEALETGSGLIIPQSLAKKWFGNENPIGQKVGFMKKDYIRTVKAVYEDFPENCSMRNAVIIRMNEAVTGAPWSQWNYYAFFRVQPGTDRKELEKKIIASVDANALNFQKSALSGTYIFEVRPIQELYFSQGMFTKHGNWALTLCLLAVGILIIVVAYINFINFSTALAPSRIGTLNICKIAGATDAVLRRQIIGEAVLLSVLAWGIAFFWVGAFSGTALAKAYFNASLNPVENYGLFLLLGAGALVLGLLTGLYPAYYMTSFQPALVLKGSFALSGSGRRLRNGLLLFQFVVTIVLVIASLFVVLQYRYIRNLPWGYEKENVVYFQSDKPVMKYLEIYRTELMRNPNILDVTASQFVPGSVPMSWGCTLDSVYMELYIWPVAPNFLSFFDMPVYKGETLREPPGKKDYMLLNRSAVEKYQLQDAIGKDVNSIHQTTIIGFAENVNFASLHQEIEPMAFICGEEMAMYGYILMKIRPENVPQTVEYIKDCLKRLDNKDVEVTFLEDDIDHFYQKEKNLSHLISLFCVITVLISLAGIYGLILFNIRYKIKEIGVRKINGATSGEILWRLNRIFIRLVAGGFIIALPLAYILVDGWLNGYPYRTPIYWWVFVVACLITLVITLATVSYQSWKAANANPVDAVKAE